MNVQQIYTKCLAQGAYFIESNGEVAIIDPLREVQQYIDLADAQQAKIKYIFETHFHADFVSGHVSLAEKTGASIVYGPNAAPNFKAIIAQDQQIFQLGALSIKVLHTPGHTMESTTYLLLDEQGAEQAIFTGDTLFLGDVGRPDLAQKAANLTQEQLAGILFESLRSKIMPLPNHVIVYPGHGAGSACGKNMSDATSDTLGAQKQSNYALRANMTKEEFIQEVTEGIVPPPAYFPLNVALNKNGYVNVEDLLLENSTPLEVETFKELRSQHKAMVLDVRHQRDFVQAHIPRSIFIGIDGDFAPWVGTILKDTTLPILLVADSNRVKETIVRLSRVGFDHVLGYLQGGVSAWEKAGEQTAQIASISADEFAERYQKNNNLTVIDVRKPSEFDILHLAQAQSLSLASLDQHISNWSIQDTAYIHCAGGYRSVIACSLLQAAGINHVVNIEGGFAALQKTSVPVIIPHLA